MFIRLKSFTRSLLQQLIFEGLMRALSDFFQIVFKLAQLSITNHRAQSSFWQHTIRKPITQAQADLLKTRPHSENCMTRHIRYEDTKYYTIFHRIHGNAAEPAEAARQHLRRGL